MSKASDYKALDKFGEFIVKHCRDKGIFYAEGLLKNHWKSPSKKKLQSHLSKLSKADKAAFLKAIISTIDTSIHDFLFAIQENSGNDGGIKITVDGKDIAAISDGLHGEAFSEEGWYAKYSNYGESKE
jgi:hypothetical protein